MISEPGQAGPVGELQDGYRDPAPCSEFFLDLTFATRNPLNGLTQENPSEVFISAR